MTQRSLEALLMDDDTRRAARVLAKLGSRRKRQPGNNTPLPNRMFNTLCRVGYQSMVDPTQLDKSKLLDGVLTGSLRRQYGIGGETVFYVCLWLVDTFPPAQKVVERYI